MSLELRTFCGVIEKELATPTCPLPKNTCMWCHKETKQCMYDDDIVHPDEEKNRMTTVEFAQYVGLPTIPTPLVNILKQSLIIHLKKNI